MLLSRAAGESFTLDLVSSTSSSMSEKATRVCEQERRQVLDRTNRVLVPSPTS
jgi:hypothetical protein